MSIRKRLIFLVAPIIVGILLIVFSYKQEDLARLIIGSTLLMVSIFVVILLASLSIFTEDKKLDIPLLIKQGFKIVECPKCNKENVLVDKYCIFCGEPLADEYK